MLSFYIVICLYYGLADQYVINIIVFDVSKLKYNTINRHK